MKNELCCIFGFGSRSKLFPYFFYFFYLVAKKIIQGKGVKRADMRAEDSKGLTPLSILRERGFGEDDLHFWGII